MENIRVTDLGNGFFRLVAEEGFRLYALNLGRFVSEAVVKEESFKNFKAVDNG